MSNKNTADELLDWKRLNLVSHANLNKNDIGRFFAPHFSLKANGRSYDATHDNYYDFLNRFRADIESLNEEVKEQVESQDAIVVALTARIKRTNGKQEVFESMILMRFDQNHKIILWYEVYYEVPKA